jgi:hypothetical protein
MYSASYDWGKIGSHKFEINQHNEMKKECQTHCFSTLNHNPAYCHDTARDQVGPKAGGPSLSRRERELRGLSIRPTLLFRSDAFEAGVTSARTL